ncbi:MAG: anti-sigma-F factor Fin [Sulfobacillus sp.]
MVRYVCRHCRRRIGEFGGDWTDKRLGLHSLSADEQEEILEIGSDGTALVKVLCDHCLPVPWMDDLWYN